MFFFFQFMCGGGPNLFLSDTCYVHDFQDLEEASRTETTKGEVGFLFLLLYYQLSLSLFLFTCSPSSAPVLWILLYLFLQVKLSLLLLGCSFPLFPLLIPHLPTFTYPFVADFATAEPFSRLLFPSPLLMFCYCRCCICNCSVRSLPLVLGVPLVRLDFMNVY